MVDLGIALGFGVIAGFALARAFRVYQIEAAEREIMRLEHRLSLSEISRATEDGFTCIECWKRSRGVRGGGHAA